MTDPEHEIAEFVHEIQYSDLPKDVRDQVGLVIADTIGATIGGTGLPEVRQLAKKEAASNPGEATILGTEYTAAPGHAALVNGTGGTSLELDEGHKYAAGHPAIHALPVALAEAEVHAASAESFLSAFVAGYEVGVRVSRACSPLVSPYHMHGVWGTVGATAGLARLNDLSIDETIEALRIAANHALHTHFGTALEGATVRNTYAGSSNLSATQVINQAESGFTGLQDGIQRHLARTADSFDQSALTNELGELWEINRGYFKLHAACRYTHPTLDAIDELESENEISPDQIESITIETYETAAKLTPARPSNPLQAKFSLPFAAATRLVNGNSNKESFTEQAFTEPVLKLADRVTVVESDDISSRVPEERGARVSITLGTETISKEIRQARGGAQRPFNEDELREKFDTLVEPVLGSDRSNELWNTARTPANAPPRTISGLTRPDL